MINVMQKNSSDKWEDQNQFKKKNCPSTWKFMEQMLLGGALSSISLPTERVPPFKEFLHKQF